MVLMRLKFLWLISYCLLTTVEPEPCEYRHSLRLDIRRLKWLVASVEKHKSILQLALTAVIIMYTAVIMCYTSRAKKAQQPVTPLALGKATTVDDPATLVESTRGTIVDVDPLTLTQTLESSTDWPGEQTRVGRLSHENDPPVLFRHSPLAYQFPPKILREFFRRSAPQSACTRWSHQPIDQEDRQELSLVLGCFGVKVTP